MDDAAEYTLSNIESAWFVNCKSSATTSEPAAADIKDAMENALAYIVLNSSDVPNIICIPGGDDTASLLSELVGQCKGGINNTIHAQGFVDCVQESSTQLSGGNPVASAIEGRKSCISSTI